MSSDQDSIFNNTNTANPPTSEEGNKPSEFKLPDGVSEFVGEGKKYASVEDALKSVPHAQSHISNLEKELAELREQVDKVRNIEEVLAKMEEKANKSNDSETTTSVEVDEEAIAKLVESTLTKRQQQELADANILAADKGMKEVYGEKAQEVLVSKAKDLGLSVEDLMKTAARSPKAFLSLMGATNSPTDKGVSHIKSSVNTDTFSGKQTDQPTGKVPLGANTQDMIGAWRASKPQLN